MASKRIHDMSVDELRQKWGYDIAFIAEHTTYMQVHHARYQQVEAWLVGDPPLANPRVANRNLQAWGWIWSLWWRVGLMHVRREMDRQNGTVCMLQLLYELETRSDAFTAIPTVQVVADRETLERECDKTLEYANRQMAHRTQEDEPDIAQLDRALAALFTMVARYPTY